MLLPLRFCSVVNNAGIPFKQLLGFRIQIRCHLVDLVFPLTFSAFQSYPTTLPVYFQFTVTFFALHKGTLDRLTDKLCSGENGL